MLTRFKFNRGEGKLVGVGSLVGSRRKRPQFPQYPPQGSYPLVPEDLVSMSHEGD